MKKKNFFIVISLTYHISVIAQSIVTNAFLDSIDQFHCQAIFI
jgi:hypothetical protein